MHWTYAEFEKESDLEQGDLLAPTQELRAVLRDVHAHFDRDKYLAFAIATQSCDLVRRGGQPKALYISIAAVRSLKDVLPKLLRQVATEVAPGAFLKSTKLEAKRFLARLFDQNEQALGLFYLHPDVDVGLGEPSVIFLRVKVALRAEHYDVLQQARIGRLSPEFRAKFGWLLGNLYGRAATPDWADASGGAKQVDDLIESTLREHRPGAGPLWIDDELVEAGRRAKVEFKGRTHAELLAELEQHRPQPPLQRLLEIVEAEAVKVLENSHRQRRSRAEGMERTLAVKPALVVGHGGVPIDQRRQNDAPDLALPTDSPTDEGNPAAGEASAISAGPITQERARELARSLRNRLSNNGRIKNLLE